MVEPRSPNRGLIAILVVVVVVAAGLATLVYVSAHPKPPGNGLTVAVGDNVTVNYIGYFGSGPQSGHVFDTSLYSVATDNATYPKSLEYSLRGGSPSNYTPLGVYVGPNAPSGGYSFGNVTFGGVVTGFWQGLVGLRTNETRSITVPPALGYGPTDAACVRTQSLAYSIPVYQTYSTSDFASVYPGITAVTSLTFADPYYGWNTLILSANATAVVVENLATLGWTATGLGWPVTVTGFSTLSNGTQEIGLLNELSPSDAGHLLGHAFFGAGPCGNAIGSKFIVSAVDAAAGTYAEDFNPEVQGQTLVFQVDVEAIYTPGVTVA